MGNQDNNANETDKNVNASQGGANNSNQNDFSGAVEFCKKNVRYIAAAGLFIVVVFFLARGSAGQKDNPADNNTAPVPTEAVVAEAETETQEKKDDFARDAYPQINELISNYFTAYAEGDMDTLATLTENMSDTEKSYITVFSEQVENYENISCYTKMGLDDTSYIVSVSLEMKLKDVETTAPGLEFFYVRTREDGTLYIDSRYSQFNLANEDLELEPEVKELIEAFKQQEDVIALQNEIQTKYAEAIASDEDLKTMAETTIPDIIKVWASDQAEAVRVAEEEAKKKEEEEKKKAEEKKKKKEEKKKKKEEEEKKAAELAAAVTVYAMDNVNVRAEPNESAEVLGQLLAGSQTTRLEEKDGWSRVDYNNGQEGYIRSDFLSTDSGAAAAAAEEAAQAEAPAEENTGGGYIAEGSTIVLTESVIVRESMSTDSKKLATAFAGESIIVQMSYAEGWSKVSYGNITGYIRTDLLQ